MSVKEILSAGSAVAIGVAHGVLLSFVMAYLAVHFSVAAWFHPFGLGTVALNAVLFSIDLALHLVLSIPAVLVVRLLKPWHYAWYVLLALVAFLIWAHFPAVPLRVQIPLSWYTAWGLVAQVAPLPLAAWLMARRRAPPDSSIKPMPLHGTG